MSQTTTATTPAPAAPAAPVVPAATVTAPAAPALPAAVAPAPAAYVPPAPTVAPITQGQIAAALRAELSDFFSEEKTFFEEHPGISAAGSAVIGFAVAVVMVHFFHLFH